MKISRKLLLSS